MEGFLDKADWNGLTEHFKNSSGARAGAGDRVCTRASLGTHLALFCDKEAQQGRSHAIEAATGSDPVHQRPYPYKVNEQHRALLFKCRNVVGFQ